MERKRNVKEIKIGSIKIGGSKPLVYFAGPCVIESEKHCLMMAHRLREIFKRYSLPWVFKASYDKANRTSIKSYRGPGLKKGLAILNHVKEEIGVPILTDVHCVQDVELAASVADVLQIPAFLSRQTDLVVRAAQTGKVINIKKGQFLAPWDIRAVVDKIKEAGSQKILLTERGVSFGYNNLVSDMRSLPIMRSIGYPVIYDATHSVQLPGGEGNRSGGQREFIPSLARAAVAAGCDGVFMEVHQNPDHAPSDGPNMIPLKDLPGFLDQMIEMDRTIRKLKVR